MAELVRKNDGKPPKQVVVHIRPETHAKLKALCEREGAKVVDMVTFAIDVLDEHPEFFAKPAAV